MSSVEPEIHEQFAQGHVADLAGRRAYDQAWRQFARAQLFGRQTVVGLRLVARIDGNEILLLQLVGALPFLAGQIDARLGRLDVALHARPRARQVERGALGTRGKRRQQHAFLYQLAALHPDRIDHALDRGAHRDALARLDQAVVLLRTKRCGGRQRDAKNQCNLKDAQDRGNGRRRPRVYRLAAPRANGSAAASRRCALSAQTCLASWIRTKPM